LRAAHGEDLSIDADDEADQHERFPEAVAACAPVPAPVAASVTRDQGEYAPFRTGASSAVSDRGETKGSVSQAGGQPDPSACELLAKRLLHNLKLWLRAIEDPAMQDYSRIPEPLDLEISEDNAPPEVRRAVTMLGWE